MPYRSKDGLPFRTVAEAEARNHELLRIENLRLAIHEKVEVCNSKDLERLMRFMRDDLGR